MHTEEGCWRHTRGRPARKCGSCWRPVAADASLALLPASGCCSRSRMASCLSGPVARKDGGGLSVEPDIWVRRLDVVFYACVFLQQSSSKCRCALCPRSAAPLMRHGARVCIFGDATASVCGVATLQVSGRVSPRHVRRPPLESQQASWGVDIRQRVVELLFLPS